MANLKNRDVLVHPKWRTVHEKGENYPYCGNGQGATGRAEPIEYQDMPLNKVENEAPYCTANACVAQRRHIGA